MFYAKIFQDVGINSLLFDYIIHQNKLLAQDRSSIWWIKMRTRVNFFYSIKWKIKNRFLPFLGSVSDTLELYKVKDVVLLKCSKLRTQGFSFEDRPTCIAFRSNRAFSYKHLVELISGVRQHQSGPDQNSFLSLNGNNSHEELGTRKNQRLHQTPEKLGHSPNDDILTAYEIIIYDLVKQR